MSEASPAGPREPVYRTMKEFWPYYLTEHSNPINRALHFVGTTICLALLGTAVYLQNWWLLIAVVTVPYAFAWVGHFFIEKNRPATFTYPFKSLASDFVMWFYMLTGQIGKQMELAQEAMSKRRAAV